jgi:hypothetical protein
MTSAPSDDSRARLLALIHGAFPTQVIHAAVRLGLAELMGDEPAAADDLAAAAGADPGALKRLLRAMAVLDLCQDLDGERFVLTEAGKLLKAEAPGSVRGVALHWGERLWGALGQLEHSVRTGRAWATSGEEGFRLMARDPAQTAMFHQSMTDQTGPVAAAVLAAYDLSRFAEVMDVGGSYGALLAAVLKAHPGMRGRVFDLPDLADASAAYLGEAGVADRARFVGGDFFQSVPAGADAYLLKMIIHDWDDEHAFAILRNCREAAGTRGVVLVVERVAPARVRGPEDRAPVMADIVMLTAAGGLERTEDQYRALFARAGLRLARVVPTTSEFSVIEAVPA